MCTTTARTPPVITDPWEMVIEFIDDGPDVDGYRIFWAYWVVVSTAGCHVTHGQAFHTDPARYMLAQMASGRTVRVLH